MMKRCKWLLAVSVLMIGSGCDSGQTIGNEPRPEDAVQPSQQMSRNQLPERGDVNTQLLESLVNGETQMEFTLSDFLNFQLSDANNGEWTEVSLLGSYPTNPRKFQIKDGKCMADLDLSKITYTIHPLCYPWYAYCRATDFNKRICCAIPLSYDSAKNRLTIGTYNFRIETANNSRLAISYQDSNFPSMLDWMEYEVNDSSRTTTDNTLFFNSEVEACLTMIEMMRAEFGDSFNINSYFNGNIILDEEIVNIDELKEKVLEYYHVK